MSLIVSVRTEDSHLRFDVQGRWHYNDALNLAYQVKAAAARERLPRALIDLQSVQAAGGVEGKFLVFSRLRRALPSAFRVAVLASPDLVDLEPRHPSATASVVLFSSERAALLWLEAGPVLAIKNPPALHAEGQMTGKET